MRGILLAYSVFPVEHWILYDKTQLVIANCNAKWYRITASVKARESGGTSTFNLFLTLVFFYLFFSSVWSVKLIFCFTTTIHNNWRANGGRSDSMTRNLFFTFRALFARVSICMWNRKSQRSANRENLYVCVDCVDYVE